MSQLFTLLTIALFTGEGLAALHLYARETSVAESEQSRGLSPRPTSGPFAAKAEIRRGDAIFARSESQVTCGYVSKDINSAVYCNAGYGCGWWPTNPSVSASFGFTQGAVECCPLKGGSVDFDDCTLATSCVDYSPSLNTGADPVTVSGVQFCGTAAKRCATWVFEDTPSYFSGSAADQTYTHLFCTDENTIQKVYEEKTNGPSSAPPSSSTAINVLPSSPVKPDISTSANGGDQPSVNPTPHGKTSGGSSTNVAAIAGGTVGGIAAIALVGAVIGVLVWRKRKSRVPATPEVSTKPYY